MSDLNLGEAARMARLWVDVRMRVDQLEADGRLTPDAVLQVVLSAVDKHMPDDFDRDSIGVSVDLNNPRIVNIELPKPLEFYAARIDFVL